jgi:hypothetical protein
LLHCYTHKILEISLFEKILKYNVAFILASCVPIKPLKM